LAENVMMAVDDDGTLTINTMKALSLLVPG
jgi:hypothetical protein